MTEQEPPSGSFEPEPAPEPAKKSDRITPVQWVILAGVAILIGWVIFGGGDDEEDASGDAPASEDVVSDEGEALALWWAENSYLNDELARITTAVSEAASNTEYATVEQLCGELLHLSEEAMSADPIPVARVDVHWQNAWSAFKRAGELCQDGARLRDGDMIVDSSEFMSAGSDAINRVAEAVADI